MRTWPSALQILGLREPGVALGRITTRDESEAFCSITTLRQTGAITMMHLAPANMRPIRRFSAGLAFDQ